MPFLVLTPVFWRWTRPLALVLLVGLHGSIAAMVNLGIFSAAMIAYDPFLLEHRAVGAVRAAGAAQGPGARRVLRRRLRRLLLHGARAGAPGRAPAAAFASATSDAAALSTYAADVDRELLDRTILVVEPASPTSPEAPGRRWTRADAVAEILARAAVRRAVVVAAAGAGAQRDRERRLRRVRAQPDADLDLAGARGVRRAGRAAGGDAGAAADAAAGVGAREAAGGARARHRVGVRHPGGGDVGGEPVDSARAALRPPARMDGGGGHVPAHLRGLVAVLARGAALRRDRRRRRRDTRRPPRRSVQRGGQPGLVAARRRRARAPRSRFVLVRLHAAHPRRAHLPPGAARMDPALSRADRAAGGHHRPLRGVRDSGRTAPSRARRRPTNIRTRRFLRYPETGP